MAAHAERSQSDTETLLVHPGLGSPSVVEVAQHGILEFWRDDRYFGTYPLSDDRFGVYCAIGSTSTSLRLAQDERAGLPKHKYLDLLRTAFRSFSSMVQLLLAHLPSENEVFFDFLEEVRLPRWTRGRAALLGDAAHSMLPFGGMGASMAMEDALVVTDELAQVGTAEVALAFERYNRRRRKRVTQSSSMPISKAWRCCAKTGSRLPCARCRASAATRFEA